MEGRREGEGEGERDFERRRTFGSREGERGVKEGAEKKQRTSLETLRMARMFLEERACRSEAKIWLPR